MLTKAFILESSTQAFGGELLTLLTDRYGKIFCATDKSFKNPSIPALLEIDLIQKKEGFYQAKALSVEETFPQIRSNEQARKTLFEIHKLMKQALPPNIAIGDVWAVFSTLIPCLPLFEKETTPSFLMAYTLASAQGIDLSWIQEASHLDEAAKKALLSFPSHADAEIFSMSCPREALQLILEELNVR